MVYSGWLRRASPGRTAFCALWVAAAASPTAAQESMVARSWALLIGVEKYQHAPNVSFSANDVARLAATLHARDGYAEGSVLEVTDRATDARYQPLKARIEAELPQWFKKPGREDTVLIYFTGHGFRDAAGNLYLAPLDCNPDDLVHTAIPMGWVRQQVAGCRARFKLLVFDSCHAGSEKGGDSPRNVSAQELAELFGNLEGVVTLASSTAGQKSQNWDEKQQSLFSYWLNQGLRGHADENNDGLVDIDELYKYVYRNVTHTADVRMPLPQTPVRIVRSGSPDVPIVAELQPLALKEVLADVAEQLTDTMVERKLRRVAALEFTNDSELGELLGADFGLLGRYCAEELALRLTEQAAGKFSVVDRRELQLALGTQGFSVRDLGSTVALRDLTRRTNGTSAVVRGVLSNRSGRVMSVQCKLVRTDPYEVVGTAGGKAALNESQWAMLGRSVVVKPQDRRPELTRPGGPLRPADETVIDRMDDRAEGSHPLADPNFPFSVKLMIGGKQRNGVVRGNDYFVPVHQGEVYEIWIENRSKQIALMRLLVDGLNTLPEPATGPGGTAYIVGKRVALEEARHWVLDPSSATLYAVRGFVTDTGVKGKLREFVVADADSSLAARQKFADQIGIITAAFYAPASTARAVGTGLGREHAEQFPQTRALEPGNLLAVVHIRYVEAKALEEMKKKP